jgi:hypothetical protein
LGEFKFLSSLEIMWYRKCNGIGWRSWRIRMGKWRVRSNIRDSGW